MSEVSETKWARPPEVGTAIGRGVAKVGDGTNRHTALSNLRPDRRELDKNDIAQSFLGIIGDSDRTDVTLRVDGDPFVVGGITGCR